MKPIAVLLADDQLGADETILRAAFAAANRVRTAVLATPRVLAAADACTVHVVAVPGQIRQGRVTVNDSKQIVSAVRELQASGEVALVLLDMRFDSGPLDEKDRPAGVLGDEKFGAQVYNALRTEYPGLPVVFLSTYGEAEIGEQAAPYLSKRDLTEHSFTACLLRHAKLSTEQRAALLDLQEEVVAAPSTAAVYSEAFEIAPLNLPILITGETGTGKDVLARYIHRQSSRCAGPFVPVNVNAVPKDMFETAFFGHMRGAYTGAVDSRPGYFEQASGGTLFLDEVGDLPADLQVKLLRALETGTITRMGGKSEVPVDVRLVAATNRAAPDGAVEGLREDFRFRLSGHAIHLQPLRERREEIPILTDLMLGQAQAEYRKSGITVAESARTALAEAALPGNARELRQRLFSAVARTGSRSLVTAELLGFSQAPRVDTASPAMAGGSISDAPRGEPDRGESAESMLLLHAWLAQRKRLRMPMGADELRGAKVKLDAAFDDLNLRLAAAALEATKKPVTGEYVLAAAAQLLYGDLDLKGNLPSRRIATMLGLNQTQKLSQDDLASAIAAARSQARTKETSD